MDTMNGANLGTFAACGTKIVVYYGEVINHGDSTGGTVLLALTASDTTVSTYLAHVSTLLVVGAFYDDTGGILYHLDETIGTCS